jgi:lipopolysaccharide transport system ATP-binding protein
VEEGEVVGVIGRNGAGKSTLLKILTRITEPTTGRAEIRGRVGSLLEVGTGFHPELTGRENVFLNGAILGMRRSEIRRKFGDIVEFSGVEKFLDTPVKRYSSGMQVRLAFSVAAHLEPEILLIDEVLAVGDAAFQRKCLGKMGSVTAGGRTVVFVSHNMEAVTTLCARAIWLDGGAIRADGPSQDVVREYLASTRSGEVLPELAERKDRFGTGPIHFTSFELRNEAGERIEAAHAGDTVDFVLSYNATVPSLRNVSVYIYVKDQLDHPLLALWTRMTDEDFELLPQEGELICRVPKFPLATGTYYVDVGATVNSPTVEESGDALNNAATIEVVTGDFYGTGRVPPPTVRFMCPQTWRFGKGEG